MIPRKIIDEIKTKVDIVELVSEYVQLTQRGDKYWGLSPFKNEKTPSFCVRPSHNMYYCFSTHNGGDAFKFIMEMEGMRYPEAIEFLGRRVGIDTNQQNNKQYSQKENERLAFKNLYKRITESFHYLLLESPLGESARQFLNTRGISNNSIKNFSLGYSHPDPFWLHTFLKKNGFSEDFLSKTSLFSTKNVHYSLFHNRIMFPIRNHYGETVGFGGRAIGDNAPKYLNSPDSEIYHKKNNLYGIDCAKENIKKNKYFILCEGYFDVLAFHQSGIPYAVAPLGTACTKNQAQLLGRYAQKGTIVFDGDEAGVNAAIKAAIVMEEQNIEVSIVKMEFNTDPADLLIKNSSHSLKNLVSLSFSSIDYILDKALEISDVHTPSGKEQIVDYILPYIKSINSLIRQEASIQIVADRVAVSVQSIKERLHTNFRIHNHRPHNQTYENKVTPSIETSERINVESNYELLLMCTLAIFPEYYGYIRHKFENGKYFQFDLAKDLYSVIEDLYRQNKLEFSMIVDNISNENLKNKIQELIAKNEYGDNIQEYLNTILKKINIERLREKQKEIELHLRIRERNHDKTAIRELLTEKVYIDSMIEEA